MTTAVVVVVAMVVPAMVSLVELYFVSYTSCDFFYTVMSSVLLGGLTSIAVVALTRKHCNSFHYSPRTVVQCRTGKRRRATLPQPEPHRPNVDIDLACICAHAIRSRG